MFKKAFQIATAFGVLVAGYAVYVNAFALVARGFTAQAKHYRFTPVQSRTGKLAISLARRHFGDAHWSASKDLPIRLYNAERGFWMYAKDYERTADGKHINFWPFAVIWASRDGKSMKSATSDVAKLDLDRPFTLAVKPGASGSLHVTRATIEGDVRLRDDKGTPETADDLRIGPLTYLEYDEPKLTVSSPSDVLIEDDVYRITGKGLLIKLRPREENPAAPGTPTGFNGAQTAYLFKDVHIVINDVGAGGILPGTSAAAPAPPPPAGAAAAPVRPTPLDLRSAGLMQVDLAKPKLPEFREFVGPPSPPSPTVAHFSRDVEVLRGDPAASPDRLNCDYLRLTLLPPDREPPAGPAAAPAPAVELSRDPGGLDLLGPDPFASSFDAGAPAPEVKGPMTDLALREAVAQGHNVRLLSSAQGVKVRCNELIYKKQLPESADETYFRGESNTPVVVEKIDLVADGPEKGKVATFTTIRTIDAKIFDDRRGNDYATIVSNGPGTLESRPGPGLNGAVQYTTRWDDQCVMQPEAPAPAAASAGKTGASEAPAPVRKRITLTGRPSFTDIPSKATLEGKDRKSKIVVRLRPKAAAAAKPAGPGKAAVAPPGAGAFEIEQLVAYDNVHLNTPGKVLTARDDLQAVFIPVDPLVTPAAASTTKPAPAQAPAPAPAPAAAPAEPARPAEPEARANADRVWARVFLRPADPNAPAQAGPGLLGGTRGSAGGSKADVDEVRLRGSVSIHQDPAAGKERGTEIVGEAVDLFNQGGKGSRFVVFHNDPNAPRARDSKARTGPISADDAELFRPLAMVDSGDMVIRGQQIGLDQAVDHAWVEGNGSLTQLAARGLLNEKGPAGRKAADGNAKDRPAPAAETTPMTITFAKGMKFFGRAADPRGKLVASAEFYKDVHAESEDAVLDCSEVMRTFFDQTVKLAGARTPPRPGPAAGDDAPAAQPEPKPEIALIECVADVVVINTRREAEAEAMARGATLRGVVERQRIEGNYLIYEKATGKFRVPGEGMVHLYQLEGKGGNPLGPNPGRNANAGAARPIRPAAGPGPGQGVPVRRGGEPVVGHTENRNPADLKADRAAPRRRKPVVRPLPPLVLTQIHFTTEMNGRFGSSAVKGPGNDEPRWSDFFGDVEVLRARVGSADDVLDPDRRPDDAMFLTSQTLRVVSEPPTAAAVKLDPNAPPRYLLRAWEHAFAVSEGKALEADTITYDSLTGLFYGYGEEGRGVIIAQQDHIGQAASVAPGQTIVFNSKTGQSQLVDPRNVQFFDAKTGYRPTPVKADKDELKRRFPNRKKFQNLRGNIERKGYTGS